MMRVRPLVSLLLLHDVAAGPWRSCPSTTRLPLVLAKDGLNARALSSLSSTTIPTGTSGLSSTTGDVDRGGSTLRAEGEEEQVDKNVTMAELPPSELPSKPKKRARRKKKKLEGPHAVYAKKLKNRNSMNIRRKVMHACFGLTFGTMNYFIPKNRFVPGMTILTSATLLMELLRYRRGFGWMNDVLHFVLGKSLRKHEMEGKFTGSFYFFLGVTVTAALFPTTCATMGICQLALADPSASYFGRQTRHVYWSRIENGLGGFGRNKGFLGFIGGALFCFPFNYRVLSIAKFPGGVIPGGMSALIRASLALGFAGAFADLAVPTPALHLPQKVFGVRLPPFHVDDNFVVPIFSGFACTQLFQYLGWPGDLELARYILF